jgi:hypothetical protein
MKKVLITGAIALGALLAGTSVGMASTPRPSGYCTKAEAGKRVKYTTPSGSATYYLTCRPYTAYHWTK